MHTYIGTKMIQATPMTRGEYNDYRGWILPLNEDGRDEGYLVEYSDSKSNHENHDGYISWSPKQQFDEAYTDLGYISGRLPHQQRVIGEHAQLKKKYEGLKVFLTSVQYGSLPGAEQIRLARQYVAMQDYLNVLDERIDAFQ